MNKILNSEIVGMVADILRKAFPPQPGNVDAGAPAGASNPSASGVPAFIGNLLSSSVFSGFLGGGRPEGTLLRGSLVGLASGVDAVTHGNVEGRSQVKQRPLVAALTVCAYVAGGVIAAMIYRGMRRSAQTA
jgi:hypothetical protein